MAGHNARAATRWAEYLREDPELARIELGIARCARIMVETSRASPIYDQAVREDRRLRDDLRALQLARARAKGA